ncbi:MAG: zinc ribbon domain-containing protein [Candidatus Pacearchaeota archaeon]|jgi:hypothetical protein|nr:zinc ribbon domain-containing protein [Clostridia bacterium]
MLHSNQWAHTPSKPSAYIAVNKNRLKSYDNKVYLKDRQTFQIELFNPTQKNILSIISINGTTLQGGGLILRPGERVFLERYLNENRKFLFSTYNVSGNSAEVANAIMKNGNVDIKFYEEKLQPEIWRTINQPTYVGSPTIFNPGIYYSQNTGAPSFGTTTISSGSTCNTTLTSNSAASMSYTSMHDFNMEFSDESNTKSFKGSTDNGQRIRSKKSLDIETGRVEKGSASSQNLVYVDKEFSDICIHAISLQLLPESQKHSDSSDVNHRVYCTECGTKSSKATAKFCSNCGTRL